MNFSSFAPAKYFAHLVQNLITIIFGKDYKLLSVAFFSLLRGHNANTVKQTDCNKKTRMTADRNDSTKRTTVTV
jgi:hypothetical protein